MTDPTDRNRLDEEESPYLRQHADNPVHWQPWDEDALAAASERDVPIFLSIGYSACHWCHVMEEESFEDEGVAELLNEHFVPIKVDREERPDLDSLYMSICQQVTGRGGWPLSAWLTPDGRPFHVGTYFPKEARRGQPGFVDLLQRLHQSWEQDRSEIENRADQWEAAIEGELESTPEAGEPPGSDLLESAADQAVRSADREHGGFGTSGPKFPQAGRVHLLLRAADRFGVVEYRDVAAEAMTAMVEGGLYDHVGGGFHRYVTDREWVVPHFEKMLYDNAELSRLLLAGYQATGAERYAEVARETFAFVEREMRHPEGGFYSTLDARSEGEEGTFYVWTPEQVHEAVDDEAAADCFCDRYGVTEAGNFEGATVLTVSEGIPALAEEYDRTEEEVEALLEDARDQVFETRSERPRPARDEKVLAGWNGLMISALAEGGLVLDEEYADLAVDALEFVRDHLWDADAGRLSRRFKDDTVGIDGYLEDYAFLARGALDCYQATGDRDHLAFALDLARAVESEFWDDDAGTLYFTPASGERLVARPQEVADQSTPSSLGVAVDAMLALSHFAPHDRFEDVAERVLKTHSRTVASNPLQHATLTMAADRRATGSLELTVVADDLPAAWRDRIAGTYLPTRLLSRRPPTAEALAEWLDDLGLDDAPPVWANREQEGGEPTIYVCRSFTCSPPVTDVDAAMEWADDLAPE
ncbi:thioredoxin domain-containing protein [Halomicrococcus gelatinilyticus]|uniref:thioredoxin domain-containing protein n=1 Tax=Halomicrococcus gelatinilyticus TaxID=1702103 RepID=UPI002E0E4923